MAKNEKKKTVSGKTLNARNLIAVGSFDMYFFVIVMALLTFGLVMMFSASYVNAYYYDEDAFFYIKKQAGFAVGGIALMLLVSRIKYSYLRVLALPGLIISIILLILVLKFSVAFEGVDDFKRWLKIGPISFQPSEVAKFGMILFLSLALEKNYKSLNAKTFAVLPYWGIVGLFAGLVMLENHLSGTIIILGLGIIMTFLGGGKLRWYVAGVVIALFAVVFVLKFHDQLPEYVQSRIDAWLDKDYDPLGDRYQVNQSLYAIGSGGLFGLGLGNSKQKHLYIPMPQNDFVFPIICEELGFIGAVAVIILFALLVWRGFVIGIKAKDRFGSLLAMGIMTQIGLQAVLNILVVTDSIPNTGISLPFFSYGGTALLMQMAEMGIVLGISRYSKIEKAETQAKTIGSKEYV